MSCILLLRQITVVTKSSTSSSKAVTSFIDDPFEHPKLYSRILKENVKELHLSTVFNAAIRTKLFRDISGTHSKPIRAKRNLNTKIFCCYHFICGHFACL